MKYCSSIGIARLRSAQIYCLIRLSLCNVLILFPCFYCAFCISCVLSALLRLFYSVRQILQLSFICVRLTDLLTTTFFFSHSLTRQSLAVFEWLKGWSASTTLQWTGIGRKQKLYENDKIVDEGTEKGLDAKGSSSQLQLFSTSASFRAILLFGLDFIGSAGDFLLSLAVCRSYCISVSCDNGHTDSMWMAWLCVTGSNICDAFISENMQIGLKSISQTIFKW